MEPRHGQLAPVQLQPSHTTGRVESSSSSSSSSSSLSSAHVPFASTTGEGSVGRPPPSSSSSSSSQQQQLHYSDASHLPATNETPRPFPAFTYENGNSGVTGQHHTAIPRPHRSRENTDLLGSFPSDGAGGGTSLHNYHINAPSGLQLAPITPTASSPASSSDQASSDHSLHRRQSIALLPIGSQPNQSTPNGAVASLSAAAKKPPAQPHLKKQQACLTCKRRKTRCDAVRPICGACSRSQARAARGHALTAEVPPGPCTYPDDDAAQDAVQLDSSGSFEGSASARPAKKQKRTSLADSASTGGSVNDAQASPVTSATSSSGFPPVTTFPAPHPAPWSMSPPSGGSGASGGTKTERLIIEVQSREGGPSKVRRFYSSGGPGNGHPGMSLSNLVDPVAASSAGKDGSRGFTEITGSDGMDLPNISHVDLPQVDLLLRQMWPDLSPDLPTPDTIRHMAELFFAKHPCRTMFCKATMMARLLLPPNHPLRPHSSLIHAILAAAEPYSPLVPSMKETNPSTVRPSDTGGATARVLDPHGNLGFVPSQCPPNVSPATMESIGRGFVGLANPFETPRPEIQRDVSFGEFHLGKARREIEIALLTQNQRPLEWLQAGILVNYCLLERCRIMETFFIGACIVRTLAPAGFDKLPNDRVDASNRGIVEPATSSIIEYEQRMSVWQVYIMDVYSSGPPKFYEPCIADEKEQITTTIPILMDEVEDETKLTLSEQTLKSDDLFTRGHTDTFCLHVKSACLLKRARLITSRRGQMLARMPQPPEEVLVIDRHIREFLKVFPKRPPHIDSDWIVAEANVCVAHITLHHHFVGSVAVDANSTYGRGPIEAAAEMMLRTVHLLLASSYDLALLHTQTFVCWVVLVRVLEVKSRMLARFWQKEASAQALASVESVMQALRKAADRSWRAKTSLEICQACIDDELSDDEFADLVFLWQVIPTT